jgi:hypothetical protein
MSGSKEFVIHNIIVSLMAMFLTAHASNKQRFLDYNIMKIEALSFLFVRFNGDVLFEFPLVHKLMGLSKRMQGMDRIYNGHTWCKVKMSNIKNPFGLGFKSTKCLGCL